MRDTQLVSAVCMLVFFVAISIGATLYAEQLGTLADKQGVAGIIGYVGVTVIAVVAAPLSSLPLMPVATTMWGPVVAALTSIVGWILGSLVAFWIARTYGRVVVGRLMSLDRIDTVSKRILGNRHLPMLILLRMVVPVDILSYALGLTTTVSLRNYIIATCIGVIPFAFVFAYASSLPILPQISMLVGVCGVLAIVYIRIFRKRDTITTDTH